MNARSSAGRVATNRDAQCHLHLPYGRPTPCPLLGRSNQGRAPGTTRRAVAVPGHDGD